MSVAIAWESRGDGPPLLLIHGLGYARWGWEPVADRLAERFRVLLFDNRGIGGSDVPPGPYTAGAMAGDAAQVLDEAGVECAHVVGTSLGGMVAQELALARPDRIDRLVLACTTPGGDGAFPLPQRTLELIAEAPSLAPEVALRRFVENALADDAPAELVDRIYAHRLEHPPDPAGWAAQAAAGASFDAWDRVGGIAAPTLVLHGTADGVVDPRNAALLAERIPEARVRLFEGRGHLFFWEDPDGFVAVVEEFLA
ncbi:MAG: alpha/beta fold hydrolase [Pseudomonadota bacterium]